MKSRLLTYAAITAIVLCTSVAFAQDPPEDPLGGGFSINWDAEVFTLGAQNDLLLGRALDWFSAEDSIIILGETSFPESHQCGEDRDIAAADFNGDLLNELVVAWSRADGGVFVGIPTLDPGTLTPDPEGWHVPAVPGAAGVLYATDKLAEVLGEIRLAAGNFYADSAMEFVLAYLAADSTVSITVFDVDTSSLTPEAGGSISDQAIHTVIPEIQRFGTASRFDIATGDLDNDGTDEIVLIASDPAQTPESYLMVNVYDYDTLGQTISLVSQNPWLANMKASEVSCLRRIAATTGDFDADTLDEVAFTDDWARTDEDTLHYACAHFLDFSSDMLSIADSWDWDSTGWAHLEPVCFLDGPVYALTVYNGDLIAGGEFVNVEGGPQVKYIARWDGLRWHDLDGGMDGKVRALTVYDGDLIAGGDFLYVGLTDDDVHARRIARWDGSQWYALGEGTSAPVHALTVYDGDLIAGGAFTYIENNPRLTVNQIARWDGSQWYDLYGGADDVVRALTVYNDTLIAGGDFLYTGLTGSPDVHARRIARWDGSQWYALGEGTSAPVRALTVYDGDLIAGGDFDYIENVPRDTVDRIARWDGSAWYSLGSGVNNPVYSLAPFSQDLSDDVLVAGGDFTMAGGVGVRRIAKWNGSEWASMLEFGLNEGADNRVYAFALYNSELILGGSFETILLPEPSISCPYVARFYKYESSYKLDSFIVRSDFIVDILADDVDYAPDGADEIILRGYQDPHLGAGAEQADALTVFGVDDSFAGCIRSVTPIAAVWGINGIYGSRRTMAVGNFDGDDNNYKDLLLLRRHRILPATMILAYAIDTTVLAPCSSPAGYSLPTIDGWTDTLATITELVLADIDTNTIVIGKPTYYRKTDIMQPLVVLNAPPIHFDVLNDKTDTVDINFRYFENPDNCETYSVYQKKTGYTMDMKTEVTKDWGISSSLDLSVGAAGTTVKAHMGMEYGEQFSETDQTVHTIELTATVTTGDDDQVYATQIDYDIWEYPIFRGGVRLDGALLVVSPQPSQDVFSACKNPDRDQWIPNHEVENVLSYPDYGSLTDNHQVASENVLTKGNTGFTLDEYPWSASWAILQTDFTAEEVEQERNIGYDVGGSVTTGGSFLGIVNWGVEVKASYEYDKTEISTYKTTVTDACSLGVYLGCINTNLGVCNYTVTPYAYWANNGALVVDYTTSPMVAGQGEDPTWWQIHYEQKDPAFILPWRLDDVKGEPLASEEARYRTREIIFHPDLPNPGEVVTITARVHNFGLEPILYPVGVSFYLGDPDNFGQPIYDDISGDSIFYTAEGIMPQDAQFVTVDWQLPGEGNITSCQRIWALIDPLDSITNEVHDNGDWATNNKGWRLLYVDTDVDCIDRDGDGWEESAFRCCDALNQWDNCPAVFNDDQTDSDGDGIGDACEDVICGDANGDIALNVGDAVYLINYVFKSGPAPDPLCGGDANDDDGVNVGDAVYMINYVFKSGPPPPETCCQ